MARTTRRTWKSRILVGVALAGLGVALALPGAVATASPQAQAPARPTAGVPKDFRANSITWLTPQQGWVLGAATCSPKPCSDVIATTDAGATWSLVGTVPAPIIVQGEPKPLGVSEVRFATPKVGWAFAPLLLQTTDGGASWTRQTIPGGGKQVLSLATNAHGAYAVVSGCRWEMGLCKTPLSFWHTTSLTGGSWTQISMDLPVSIAADVAVFHSTVYVVDPQLENGGAPDKLYASTDGSTFSPRKAPCDHAQDIELTQAVATSSTHVDLLCVGNPGMSKAIKTVYRSKDTGTTDTYAGMAGLYGIQSQLAASRSGNLVMQSVSDGSFIYVNDTRKTAWTMVEGIGDGGRGWNDIAFTTNKDAWVVYSPASFFKGDGILYVSHDGGTSWAPSPY